MQSNQKGTFAFITLGCPKNTVDSERMLGRMAGEGYVLQPDPDGADLVIVNTCGFIEPARQESMGVINEMIELKQQGRVGSVVVAGCLAERKREELLEVAPGIDRLVGVFGREEITEVCDSVIGSAAVDLSLRMGNGEEVADRRLESAATGNGRISLPSALDPATEQRTVFRPAPVRAMNDQARLRVTPRHYAYLKISEGCDRLCTFCAIPGMRGKHITKPIEQVVDEAQELAEDGVRELILVAQDTTYYGLDLYGEVRLAALLKELEKVSGIEWIRILYVYPIFITDELLNVVQNSSKIIPYLDMPLQHINDRVLKRMQRKVNRTEIERVVGQLRETRPGLALRTTFVVGFPGETEEQFEELCEYVQAARFERMGVFTYSYEPGTPSVKLDGHLPEEEKGRRRDHLMKIQQEIAFNWSLKQVGQEREVIIDGPDVEAPGWFLGRSHADAPDIDGLVRVKSKRIQPGDIVTVKITGADGYDLTGRAIGAGR